MSSIRNALRKLGSEEAVLVLNKQLLDTDIERADKIYEALPELILKHTGAEPTVEFYENLNIKTETKDYKGIRPLIRDLTGASGDKFLKDYLLGLACTVRAAVLKSDLSEKPKTFDASKIHSFNKEAKQFGRLVGFVTSEERSTLITKDKKEK